MKREIKAKRKVLISREVNRKTEIKRAILLIREED